MKYEIKSASANYTGGGIYVYQGELLCGLWFMACDTWESILICDANPNCDGSDYPEWQNQHYVEELIYDDYVTFFNAMLRHIIDGKPSFEEIHNFDRYELEERYIKR